MTKEQRKHIDISELECKIRISMYVMNERVEKFKIGKTADPLDKRFDENEEYRTEYDDIKLIYETSNKWLVDELEKILIRDYMLMYPTRCGNKQVGSGPNCADSDNEAARIYLVVKYRK